jgi:aquaporin Z
MKNYLTEFIGTFFLVLTVALTVLSGSALAPLAIGASLMIMVYMGGHVSGAHYNPAVTLAVFLRGKLPAAEVGPYMASQVLGSVAAAGVAAFLTGRTLALAPGAGVTSAQAVLTEVLYTFALALVVLNVATSTKTANNSFYGLAIGFTIVVAAFAGGGISGGAFNPAVGIGPNVVHGVRDGAAFLHIWIYIVGPLAGGALAAAVFKVQDPGPLTVEDVPVKQRR